MSCKRFVTAVSAGGGFDDLSSDDRRMLLEHLRQCRTCRRQSLAVDGSLVFESLPPIDVSPAEIERIRDSVRILRRANEVERSTAFGRWAGRAAAVAALFIVVLMLDPKRPDQLSEETPFAGALGVGAGQLELGGTAVDSNTSELRHSGVEAEDELSPEPESVERSQQEDGPVVIDPEDDDLKATDSDLEPIE